MRGGWMMVVSGAGRRTRPSARGSSLPTRRTRRRRCAALLVNSARRSRDGSGPARCGSGLVPASLPRRRLVPDGGAVELSVSRVGLILHRRSRRPRRVQQRCLLTQSVRERRSQAQSSLYASVKAVFWSIEHEELACRHTLASARVFVVFCVYERARTSIAEATAPAVPWPPLVARCGVSPRATPPQRRETVPSAAAHRARRRPARRQCCARCTSPRSRAWPKK